jgi:hypothetical protein
MQTAAVTSSCRAHDSLKDLQRCCIAQFGPSLVHAAVSISVAACCLQLVELLQCDQHSLSMLGKNDARTVQRIHLRLWLATEQLRGSSGRKFKLIQSSNDLSYVWVASCL